MIDTVFGKKLKLYLDYTASGQELYFVLGMMKNINELYANSHTETSYTGAYINSMLNQAEQLILQECKASEKDYFINGGGSGCTFAIEMTQKILGTYVAPATEIQFSNTGSLKEVKDNLRKEGKLPLVIVTHYEHHSNEVTWRNQLCDVIVAPATSEDTTDLVQLEKILSNNANRRLIGSFSAGSNVTGIKTNIEAIARLMKKYQGLCFFDYGALGPYSAIDLSLREPHNNGVLIDGVYISPHKFLGGPGSCGILIMNRLCYNQNLRPTHGGGGTVDFVNSQSQIFTEDVSHREKSGTPGILQMIKASLAFQLKGVLQNLIDEREPAYNERFFRETELLYNLEIYGTKDKDLRVGIMSFNIMIDGPKGKRYLHQNLTVRLLNDIFGIQARSGCSCAGPYGHRLFNIDQETSDRAFFWIAKHPELDDHISISGIKLGWARINLHYTLNEFELDYLYFALHYLSEHAFKFLPLYMFDPLTGNFRHHQHSEQTNSVKINEILDQKRQYAKDEHSRMAIFKKQQADAVSLLENLPKSKGYDSIPELGKLCSFYVEKGNIIGREAITAKAAIYNKVYGA